MEYHADRFVDHSLCIFREEKLCAILPACTREKEFISHGGLTFGGILCSEWMKTPTMLEIFDVVLAYLCEQGFSNFLYKAVPHIYHRYPAEEDRYALFRNGAILTKCEVTSTISNTHRVDYSERRRRGIKKAQKLGAIFEISQNYTDYFAMVGEILQDKYNSQPTHTASEMALLAQRFPEHIALWIARNNDNKMLAGVIMYADTQVAHAQYIATSAEGRISGMLDALFDHLIQQAYAKHPYFDFGISTEDAGQSLNTGLITQKEEFGARATVHETYMLQF